MAHKEEVIVWMSAKDRASPTLKRVTGMIKGIVGAYLGFRLVKGAVGFMKDAIQASESQEEAVARLNQQLRNHNELTAENTKSLQDQASALQLVTGFADEQTIAGQAMLASFALTTDQIQQMTPRMLDVAIMNKRLGEGMTDLTAIAKMVGVALGGQAGRLVQMGIRLDDNQKKLFQNANAQDRFNMLLEIFDDNAKGLAKSYGETFAGSMKVVNALIGDAKEKIGDAIVKSEGWKALIDELKKGLQDLNNWIKNNQTQIGEWSQETALAVVTVSEYFVKALANLKFTFHELQKGGLEIGKAISYLIPGGKEFRDIAGEMQQEMERSANAALNFNIQVGDLAKTIKDRMSAAFEEAKTKSDEVNDDLDAKPPFKPIVDSANEATKAMAEMPIDQIAGSISGFAYETDYLAEANKRLAEKLSGVNDTIGKTTESVLDFSDIGGAAVNRFGDFFADSFTLAFQDANKSWGELTANFLRDIALMLAKMAIMKLLTAGLFKEGGSVPMMPFSRGGLLRAQHGLRIPGYGGGDRWPVMTEGGEYVNTKETVQRLGPGFFEALDRGENPMGNFIVSGPLVQIVSTGDPAYDGKIAAEEFVRTYKELKRRKKI